MIKKYFNQLVNKISQLESEQAIKLFLEGLLTPSEIDEISKRLEIIKRLKAGEPQRKIAKDLNLGIATVTRGSNELKKGRFQNV